MTVHYKTRGFVFKKEDRLDADRVFSLFTHDFGRLDVFGKAIRKINSKLKGGIEIFCVSDIEFIQGKTKKTLTDAVTLQRFKRVEENPESYRLACGMMQLVDRLVREQQKDEKLIALLLEIMDMVNSNPPRQLMYYYFFWKLMEVLGHASAAASYDTICAMSLAEQQALVQKSKEHQRHIFSTYAYQS
jgi:DNA repair protein RecO (recombination protein O)